MESGEKVVRISVRNLVEFILKEGDIDNRITAGTAEKDAMLMGSRLHRKIQKSMGLGSGRSIAEDFCSLSGIYSEGRRQSRWDYCR